jgi:hypothetical protein
MVDLKGIGISRFRAVHDACVSLASRGMEKELARRNALRGLGGLRWFAPEEAATAGALARIMVPSDEETPGIDDIDVLGPPAIEILDRLLKADAHKQYLYSRGLLSFDMWAMKAHGCKFAEMTANDQVMLVSAAQKCAEELLAGSAIGKAWRRLRSIAGIGSGRFFAAQLFREIRRDCLQVFYTSRVSWVWLEYDGPPMDEGYPRLAPRR